MEQLTKDLQAVSKSLKQLTRKAEQLVKKLDKIEKTQTAKKAKAKARAKPKPARASKKKVAKKPTRVSASRTLLAIIKRSRKGIDTAALKKKTGFEDRKIWNVINSLKSRGKIESGGRGLYVKA